MPTLATKKPMNAPVRKPKREREQRARAIQGTPNCTLTSTTNSAIVDAARDAGGQVDLAEQQHEHERHAEHDERGRLGQQVREVALGEEERAEEREQDAQHDEAADGGQGAHVAAAHALAPGLDLVAEAALLAAADEVAR